MKKTGKINIGGKYYAFEVKNFGTSQQEYRVEGMLINDFLETLNKQDVEAVSKIGMQALKDERDNINRPKGFYQYHVLDDVEK